MNSSIYYWGWVVKINKKKYTITFIEHFLKKKYASIYKWTEFDLLSF